MNILDIRKQWMRMMGLDDDEIERNCIENPPVDIDEEVAQLSAAFNILTLNEYRRLERECKDGNS